MHSKNVTINCNKIHTSSQVNTVHYNMYNTQAYAKHMPIVDTVDIP